MMWDEFEAQHVEIDGCSVFLRTAGSGSPLLLLHGFPQTHIMWREVALELTGEHTVVCADLPGYGGSGCPTSDTTHSPYSKRAMAQRLTALMGQLGHNRFGVIGHDRGGRVAYRMALDHPESISRVAVLDVLPIATSWEHTDARLALAFWPWSLLAQPEPLPERLVAGDPEAVVDNALTYWGSPPDCFPPAVRAAYIDALTDPEHVHAICEEYRAAATVDREHDVADRDSGKRITSPLMVLWSSSGGLSTWYSAQGGPLELWRLWADDVQGEAIKGGHFFAEENPTETVAALQRFFA